MTAKELQNKLSEVPEDFKDLEVVYNGAPIVGVKVDRFLGDVYIELGEKHYDS